jgi:hypothetical protein
VNNPYRIEGDLVYIHLNRRDGNHKETVIELADLPIADSFQGSWYAQWCQSTKGFYVRGFIPGAKPRKRIALHALLFEFPVPPFEVDHENHDTLDNRRSNLSVVTRHENVLRRRLDVTTMMLPRSLRSKGYVYLKDVNKWRVKLERYGKTAFQKTVATEEEAIALAAKIRTMPEFFPQAA